VMSLKGLLLPVLAATVCCGVIHAGFLQVDTPFGPATALEDLSTQIEWLHLTLTNNHSFNDVTANLAPGGIYSGWRYATPTDLSTFFNDYDGGVVNDTLALALMNDLGGPLQDIFNPSNGFHRMSSVGFLNIPFSLGHALYGYIAVDNFFGPSISPGLQGSAVDNMEFNGTGHWLVESDAPEPGSLSLCVLIAAGAGIAKLRRVTKFGKESGRPALWRSSVRERQRDQRARRDPPSHQERYEQAKERWQNAAR